MQPLDAPFDPEAILAELTLSRVDFVVIGAHAAVKQGWSETTGDIDITPDRDVRNLQRLAGALHAMDARVLDADGEIDHHGRSTTSTCDSARPPL